MLYEKVIINLFKSLKVLWFMVYERKRKISVGSIRPKIFFKDTIYVSLGYHNGEFNGEAESGVEFAYLQNHPGYNSKSIVTRVSSIQADCHDLGSFLEMLREQNTSEGQKVDIVSRLFEDAEETHAEITNRFD